MGTHEKRRLSMHPAADAAQMGVLTLDFSRPFGPQVNRFLQDGPDLRNVEVALLPGQAFAAQLVLPALEMIGGLPRNLGIVGFGREAKVVGEIDLESYRHAVARPARSRVPAGEAFPGWTVLDGRGRFGERDSAHQVEELAAQLECGVEEIRVLNVALGHVEDLGNIPAGPAGDRDLLDILVESGLTQGDLASQRVLFNPPGHGGIATVQATAIYGLFEVWPTAIRLAAAERGAPFRVVEIGDAQGMRQFGVHLAAAWREMRPTVLFRGDIPEEMRRVIAAIAEEHGVSILG